MAFMNQITLIACVSFAAAILVETLVSMLFLHRLRTRYPRQWMHAAQPRRWQDRTLLSARSTMNYLEQRDYLASQDGEGRRYCRRHRTIMLVAYWVTAATGLAALLALALYGW